MSKLLEDVSCDEAKSHFLKGSSYFNGDFPEYIDFEKILQDVSKIIPSGDFFPHKSSNPANSSEVNYSFTSNKDGRFAWRPYELMHPAIYVSLVNVICDEDNWTEITARLASTSSGVVECTSRPVISQSSDSDKAAQISSWWQRVEQRSLCLALNYSHLLHTDVTDCYGSLYTHSIPWAIHGKEKAKQDRNKKDLVGNKIDRLIQAGRYGQTNGISQGSVLMDFVAEIVLAYVDEQISLALSDKSGFHILRYRDDYRIFTNSDQLGEQILKTVSDCLRDVGMKLGAAKTLSSANVIEGSVKPDKLAGISLKDLGKSNAKTIQKQLLRLHAFGMEYPNSGALRRLLSGFHEKIANKPIKKTKDLEVQVSILTDIAVNSPLAFPPIAALISHLLKGAPLDVRKNLWRAVSNKMKTVPYNGYQQVWLQRVCKPAEVGLDFPTEEKICQIVDGEPNTLWDNSWIKSKELSKAIEQTITVDKPESLPTEIAPSELELFHKNAYGY